jgi:kynureninase
MLDERTAAEDYGQQEAWSLEADRVDPLAGFRARFHAPTAPGGEPLTYFCGNSLGLQPRRVGEFVEQELTAWADLAVGGHFKSEAPWYSYHELFRESMALLVGAQASEVVVMNSLTANLHLMMVSFYRPTARRHKILVEHNAFPSDNYAVRSQLRLHGYDPAEALLTAEPRAGELTLRTEDVEGLLGERGEEIALVMMGGVNFFSGQAFDLGRITAAARGRGCRVGFDLAHAAGNVPLRLHDQDVDFAVWCSYKYLNAGPGAVAGCFVHERHGRDLQLPRFAGWWGNDPETRFRMQLEQDFVPQPGAAGWQLSNPPVLAMAPLRASLELFDQAGLQALRTKSLRLTGYLEWLIGRIRSDRFELITPREPEARGCQLSIRVKADARGLFDRLVGEGFVGDFRAPDVIRVAPVPLYNSYHQVWRFAQVLAQHTSGSD